MLNVLSLLIGLVAGSVALFGIIPFVGWANWFVLPIAGLGLVLGLISSRKEGQILNLVVIAIALVRLSLGAGLFDVLTREALRTGRRISGGARSRLRRYAPGVWVPGVWASVLRPVATR